MRWHWSFLALLVLHSLVEVTPAQVIDSAEWDGNSLRCGINYYYPGIGISEVSFQITFWSDNVINKVDSIVVPLRIIGSNIVAVDTTTKKSFAGSIVAAFQNKRVTKFDNADPAVPPFYLVYSASNPGNDVNGTGVFANVVVRVNDSCTICIDTFFSETIFHYFYTQTDVGYQPYWNGPYCCKVVLVEYLPGDVNLDKNVNIVDVVAQVGYVFRQREPESVQAADVNADCRVTLADIFYLANYVFRAGEKPRVGCIL